MVQSWKDRDIWPARLSVLLDGSQTLVDEEEPHTHLKITHRSKKTVKLLILLSVLAPRLKKIS